ncbi:hypothetical protein [Foetidibacter luteolus]|uniref:hypothetical protein n=1 Tax=Foetidibacter luteolus TaxID=2608880 RepID=UPI00129A4A38|nr:hypothetical protein [Foetidibacter luteolus]
MKRLVAILFTALYFSFTGGVVWSDLRSAQELATNIASEERNSGSEESAEVNLHALTAARNHINTDSKNKIVRPVISVLSRVNLQLSGAFRAEQLARHTVSSPVSLTIRHCVFRL